MASQPKKYRAACDQCHNSKVKCPGEFPLCKRCADGSLQCRYTLAARVGKPPGSKNKKTREKIRQASQPVSNQDDSCRTRDMKIPSRMVDKVDAFTTAVNTESAPQGCSGPRSPLRDDSLLAMQHSPTLMDSFEFQEYEDFSTTPAQNLPDNGLNLDLSTSEVSNIDPVDTTFPNFAEQTNTDSNLSWTDPPDETWASSSSSTHQQRFPNAMTADSPLSTSPNPPMLEVQDFASLESVIAQLEETSRSTTGSSGSSNRSQTTWCQCLRNYTDVLCHLHMIERCQHPLQLDIVLLCTNSVFNITEKAFHCTKCLYNSQVLMQLVMVLQTIFKWTQIECCHSGSSNSDVLFEIGRHILSREERGAVKAAVIVKALDRHDAILRISRSRVEHMKLRQQWGTNWDYEGPEMEQLQQAIDALIKKCDQLRRIALKEADRGHEG